MEHKAEAQLVVIGICPNLGEVTDADLGSSHDQQQGGRPCEARQRHARTDTRSACRRLQTTLRTRSGRHRHRTRSRRTSPALRQSRRPLCTISCCGSSHVRSPPRLTLAPCTCADVSVVMLDVFFREIRSRGSYRIPRRGPVIFVAAPHANQAPAPLQKTTTTSIHIACTDFAVYRPLDLDERGSPRGRPSYLLPDCREKYACQTHWLHCSCHLSK